MIMSMVNEQAVFLLDVTRLIEYATEQGFVVTCGEAYLTCPLPAVPT